MYRQRYTGRTMKLWDTIYFLMIWKHQWSHLVCFAMISMENILQKYSVTYSTCGRLLSMVSIHSNSNLWFSCSALVFPFDLWAYCIHKIWYFNILALRVIEETFIIEMRYCLNNIWLVETITRVIGQIFIFHSEDNIPL